MSWHVFWLTLHTIAAVVAFGPTFTFPLIAAMARKSPEHAAFAAEVSERISQRFTIPFALTLPVTGTAMIFTAASISGARRGC